MMSEQINFNLNQCTKPPLTREYAEIAARRQRKNGDRVNVFYCTECAAYHTGDKYSHKPQPLQLITDTNHQFRILGV